MPFQWLTPILCSWSHALEPSLSQHKAFNYVILPFKLWYHSNCLQETFQTLQNSPNGSSRSSLLLNPFPPLAFLCALTEWSGPWIFSYITPRHTGDTACIIVFLSMSYWALNTSLDATSPTSILTPLGRMDVLGGCQDFIVLPPFIHSSI